MNKSLQSALGLIDGRTVAGYARDGATPDRRFAIEIIADDVAVALVRADQFSPALADIGAPDATYGFVYALSDRLAATTRIISARLANLDTVVGAPIDLDAQPKPDPMLAAAGAIESIEGLVIKGWVKAPPKSAMLLRAVTAGEEIAATIARNWSSHVIGGEPRPVIAFKLVLPEVLADGRPHDIEVTNSNGVMLAGSPVRFDGCRPAPGKR